MTDRVDHENPFPLREQLEDALRREILDGRFRHGERLPSVRELAATFRVSKSTAANAIRHLRQQGFLRTREKKGVFLPSRAGGSAPRRQRTGNIGVFAQGAGDALRERPYFETFNGISGLAEARGCKVLYLGTAEADAEERNAATPLGIRDIDGLVYIIVERPSGTFVREIRKRDLPFVTTDWFDAEFGADGVVMDNLTGTREVMRHLLGLGHRRIAFINSLGGQSAEERLAAYKDGVAEAGLPFDPRLVRSAVPHVMGGRDAMRELLPLSPTAVFAFSDFLGLGAILAAEADGLAVPDDLSVACFGNEGAALAQGLGKRLTTVDVDFREMGRAAAQALLKRMDGHNGPAEMIQVEARLVVGDTTGACRLSRGS
jgi:LacI family transcriptional regulator